MPRVKPHAKIHVTLSGHRKTATMFADNDLFALYSRLLLIAVERFADRTGDSFTIHDRELVSLTGKGRADVARRLLRRLADVSPISAEPEADLWRITIPNFAKKQGFGPRNGAVRETPITTTITTTTTKSSDTGSSQMTMAGLQGKSPGTVEPKNVRPEARAKSLALDVWPELVERAASHGKTWSAAPQKNQLAKVTARIREGATRVQLLDAIDGFAALHGDRLDSGDNPMRKFFRATTIYQPTKFEEYLEAANDASEPDARKAARARREEEILANINSYEYPGDEDGTGDRQRDPKDGGD